MTVVYFQTCKSFVYLFCCFLKKSVGCEMSQLAQYLAHGWTVCYTVVKH
jgi:hypothetical protein